MLKLHLVRHGESTDNLKALWAGWKDAPLSNHGMAQAKRLGQSLAAIPIARIYCSDLKRAHWTALQIHSHNGSSAPGSPAKSKSRPGPSSPRAIAGPASALTMDGDGGGEAEDAAAAPTIASTSSLPAPITTRLLREQHFGEAEGHTWSSGAYSHSDWSNYRHSFPGGESLIDVGARAEEVVRLIVLPWAARAAECEEDVVIVMVAHGILAQALSRRSLSPLVHVHFGGLLNTSYHSFTIEFEPLEGYEPDLFDDELPSPYPDATARFTLRVDRTAEAGHLDGLKRQKAGIGRIAHDPSQRKLSDFFAGGGTIRTSRA